jgi:hypothetical protein
VNSNTQGANDMTTLSKTAGKTLNALIGNLEVGESRKIDNAPGCYMAVHVERLTEHRFSVAHYYEQNGDLCADPDMEFLRLGLAWVPVAIQQWSGYRRAAELDGDAVTGWYPRECRDQASFAGVWMRNIKEQQGGLRALRYTPAPRATRVVPVFNAGVQIALFA